MSEATLRAALADLVLRWTVDYQTTVAQLTESQGEVVGVVVSAAQAAQARETAARWGAGCEVVVLADPMVPPPLGWARAETVVGVYREPALARLTTEVHPGEGPLRVLAGGETRLVQADDGTLGWVDAGKLVSCAEPDAWPPLPPLGHGAPPPAIEATGRLWAEAEPLLGVPYVLGGRSARRIDCSGLVSLVFRRALGRITPRHSTDLMRLGERVALSDLAPGDLVFARLLGTQVPHVGLVLQGPDVLHASQRRLAVVREPLSAFFDSYRFMGGRRLLGAPGSTS